MRAKGFTLIELAVVLAIISVLAAILTPVVTGYLDQARIARASADARVIADAIRLYQRDVGAYPIYDTTNGFSTDTAGSTFIAGPAGAGAPTVTVGGWAASVSATTLSSYLNTNVLGRSTTAALGRVAFRGPYLGNLEADPWGNKYYLTAANTQNSSTNWAFVISAGPNGAFETNNVAPRTSNLSPGGDDIVAIVK